MAHLQALLDCLMYKLSYYRYAEAATMTTGQYGYDRVRNVAIGRPDIELEYFEEVCLPISLCCLLIQSEKAGSGLKGTFDLHCKLSHCTVAVGPLGYAPASQCAWCRLLTVTRLHIRSGSQNRA